MEVTRTLAEFVANTRYKDIPVDVREKCKLLTLNILGCALGGCRTALAKKYLKVLNELGEGKQEATVIGYGRKVPWPQAAFLNSNLMFMLDYEDMLYYVTHPAHVTVSSGLALGEKLRASGRDLITAVVVGIEVLGRIGVAVQPSPERAKAAWGESYHPFAAAATVGNMLRLNAAEIEVSFGIAGAFSPVPSAWKYFGPVKSTRPMREIKLCWGWMTLAGVMAGIHAKAGFNGGLGVLDGEEGWWAMNCSDKCDWEKMVDGLGKKWVTLDAVVKMHPSIGWNHAPVNAAQHLMTKHELKATDVDEIRVVVPEKWVENLVDYDPAGMVDAMFSLPYSVATTILGEKSGPEMYLGAKMRNRRVRDMLRRIRVEGDKDAERLWFEKSIMSTTVHIKTKNGKVFERHEEWPKDERHLGTGEVKEKFLTLASPTINSTQANRVIKYVEDLEKLNNVRKLADSLRP